MNFTNLFRPRGTLLPVVLILALVLAGCTFTVEEPAAPIPSVAAEMVTYTHSGGFFTAKYPVDWVALDSRMSQDFDLPFPNAAIATSQEVVDLGMAEQMVPEGEVGTSLMLMPSAIFAEAGVTAETPLEELASVVLYMLTEGEEVPMQNLEVLSLANGKEAVRFLIEYETEDVHVYIYQLGDGILLFSSSIVAPGYSNDELMAQVEAIVSSVELTADAGAVTEDVMDKMAEIDEAASAEAMSPNEVTFTASEFEYDGPETIPGGMTHISLENTGEQSHSLWLVKLDEGYTGEDVINMLMSEEVTEIPAWVTFYGGVETAPATTNGYTIDLAEGNYFMFSISSGEDEIPDVAKGMMADLIVEAEADPDVMVELPTADVSIELIDFNYVIEGEIKAGEQLVQITNTGMEPHELALAKLVPDATMEDMVDSMMEEEPSGPPPFEWMRAEVPPLSDGMTAWYTLDLEPGNYVMTCFVPSPANEGAPHMMLGMMRQFTVE